MRDSYTKNKQRLTKSRGFVPAVALVVVGLLTLTGCNSPGGTVDPTGTATAQATSSAAVTTSPPPTTAAPIYKPATDRGPAENVPVPVLPAKAKEFSKEGLIAFSEYWYETLGYVYETGDSNPMMAVTGAGCKTCSFINEPVSGWYTSGGWIVGGQMTVLETTSSFVETAGGAYQALLLVRQAKVTYYSADGSIAQEHQQTIAKTNLVEASYTNGAWTARTAEILKRS